MMSSSRSAAPSPSPSSRTETRSRLVSIWRRGAPVAAASPARIPRRTANSNSNRISNAARSSARLTSVAAIAPRTWSRSSTSTAFRALVASITSDEETETPASRSRVTSWRSGSSNRAPPTGRRVLQSIASVIDRQSTLPRGWPPGPQRDPRATDQPETMAPFDPTRAPAGRLARLGVVVDPADPIARGNRAFCGSRRHRRCLDRGPR